MDSEQYKENSKKRLLNNIKKKFDTTIIGSLAALGVLSRKSHSIHSVGIDTLQSLILGIKEISNARCNKKTF
jgi:hypothetical protein